MDATAEFEAQRPRLTGLAYRMLGSVTEAEDVVQDAWLRWERADRDDIANPAGWLTTVTSRLALDRLRADQRRKEDYVGPWLPEPVAATPGPDERVELAESLTLGFLTVLDLLNPLERAVFLLADVFGEPFPEIAAAVGRSPAACRQIASRARRRVREARADARAADRKLLERLVAALSTGEMDRVLELLAPDVVLVSDGGARLHAARRPVVGAERVARFLVNVSPRWMALSPVVEFVPVNGTSAVVVTAGGHRLVLTADSSGGRVSAVQVVLNPDKLGSLGRPVALL